MNENKDKMCGLMGRLADDFIDQGDKIFYYKKISEKSGGNGVIVMEANKKGDVFQIGEDYLRYITQLPNKNKKYIEDLITGTASTNPAVEARPQDKPAGTAFPIGKDKLSQGPYIVKDFDVMALLGLDQDDDDWRGRGQRSAYA